MLTRMCVSGCKVRNNHICFLVNPLFETPRSRPRWHHLELDSLYLFFERVDGKGHSTQRDCAPNELRYAPVDYVGVVRPHHSPKVHILHI